MLLRTILAVTTAATVLLVPAAAQAAAAEPAAPPNTAAAAEPPAPSSTATAAERAAAAAADPVIVVGGLSGIAIAYGPIAARLRADGYRVSIFQLPNLGLGDIRESARALSSYVDAVRATTGAARVDLVGHSEGGLVSRWYVKYLGGAATVDQYVSLGSPQYGTYVANLLAVLGLGSCAGVIACQQMTIGSSFLADLNAGDDTPGPVRWATVRTWQDELVRPVDNAVLADGATNILVQAWCPLRVVGHLGLVLDGTTYTAVRQVLAGAPVRPNCFAV
ncbi:lipase family alpha/beta hydrolase [Micromonospora marina]|uniref:lipase family alpha/beta hydrolase n=1 Tax=Micromonospora marina TaxID=307120 RepID=UPI003D70B5B4